MKSWVARAKIGVKKQGGDWQEFYKRTGLVS